MNTITNPDKLFEALERVRERGYATNDEEEINGLIAVAVLVIDRNDRVLGSVSGPVNRLNDSDYHEG